MNATYYVDRHHALNTYVKHVEVSEAEIGSEGINSVSFFADGLPGIMFQQAGSDMYLNGTQKISNLYLYGQTVKPVRFSTFGRQRVIIFYLYPYVIKSLFGIEAHEIRDNCMDFDWLPFAGVKSLREQMLNTEDLQSQVDLLAAFLQKIVIGHQVEPEAQVKYAGLQMLHCRGQLALRSLRQQLNMTERTLERKFLEHVGVTPRLYLRICRFSSAMNQLIRHTPSKLSDVAYDLGFSDQSHFIRTFREFTGCTPKEYLKNFTAVQI